MVVCGVDIWACLVAALFDCFGFIRLFACGLRAVMLVFGCILVFICIVIALIYLFAGLGCWLLVCCYVVAYLRSVFTGVLLLGAIIGFVVAFGIVGLGFRFMMFAYDWLDLDVVSVWCFFVFDLGALLCWSGGFWFGVGGLGFFCMCGLGCVLDELCYLYVYCPTRYYFDCVCLGGV